MLHALHIAPAASNAFAAIDFLERVGCVEGGSRPARASDTLEALSEGLAPRRMRVRPGDLLCRAGSRCGAVIVANSGIFRVTARTADGADFDAGFRFRGDWLGIDGASTGRHASTAIAVDGGEVWVVRLDALQVAATMRPELRTQLRCAEETERACRLVARVSMGAAHRDAEVANFLLDWTQSLVRHGRSPRHVDLRVSRLDLAGYLGIPHEELAPAIDRLAHAGALRWDARCRELVVPDVERLASYVQGTGARAPLQ